MNLSHEELQEIDSVKLFVGQIPKSMSEEELKNFFKEYGTILQTSIFKDKATDEPKGCGFVTFSDKNEAIRAINSLHNTKIFPPARHPIQVKFATGEEEKLDHKLFVGMLPEAITQEDLFSIFSQFGNIEELKILRKNPTKVCAFVKYDKKSHAIKAIKNLHNIYTIQGTQQPMTVRFADNKKVKKNQWSFPYYYYYQTPAYSWYTTCTPTNTTNQNELIFKKTKDGQIEGPLGCNLIVNNLPRHFGDMELYSMFVVHGTILSAKVYIDKTTGISRCFGFVSYDSTTSALDAIKNLDGMQIENTRLKVQQKREKYKPY